jgi:hypothetical protein
LSGFDGPEYHLKPIYDLDLTGPLGDLPVARHDWSAAFACAGTLQAATTRSEQGVCGGLGQSLGWGEDLWFHAACYGTQARRAVHSSARYGIGPCAGVRSAWLPLHVRAPARKVVARHEGRLLETNDAACNVQHRTAAAPADTTDQRRWWFKGKS